MRSSVIYATISPMGILDRIGLGKRRLDYLSSPIDLGIASPWQQGELGQIAITEILGSDIASKLPLGRSTAMCVPAVSKGRNLLVTTVAGMTLTQLTFNQSVGKSARASTQPSWIYRTDTNVTPYERMAWTVDDLIFYGFSLWVVVRGALQPGQRYAPILSAAWCPRDDWKVDDGVLYLRRAGEWIATDQDNVILFNSPFEGLLNVGASTLRGARDIEQAWIGRARNPIPLIDLHRTDDAEIDDAELQAWVDAWAAARLNPNGAVGSTPAGVVLTVHGDVEVDLFTEGRNAVRTDVGSFLNVRASMLDGTQGIDSLTYTTNEGEKNSFYEFDLPFWTLPIEARLSMDDVVPRGSYIRFDKYGQYGASDPVGPESED